MVACGASVKVDEVWQTCSIAGADLKSLHQHKPHRDTSGYEWPACPQMCAQSHVHGRYRIKMGVATGPSSLPGRAPKSGPPAKPPKVRQCPLCFELAELDTYGEPVNLDGRCTDRKACESRQPVLF